MRFGCTLGCPERRFLPVILAAMTVAVLLAPAAFAQSTYTYSGNNFDTVLGAYTTSMNNTGSFTVAVQLTPNMPAGTDISAQVLSYSFNDGVQTLTESNSYIVQFSVGTNSFCEISEYRITIWQGDSLVSGIDVVYSTGPPDNSADYGFQGVPCATIAGGRCVASDLAISTGTDYGQLNSTPGTPGSWSGPSCPLTPPAQYTYVGNTFDTVLGAYTTSMNNTGGFSVPVQLTPNLPAGTDISAQVLSYSFNDGVQTLTESNSYIVQFSVGTNSFCEISEYRITIWQGDSLVSGIDVVYSTGPPDNSADYGFQGVPCATIAGGRCVASDLAISTGTDYGQLNSIPGTPGSWSGPSCPLTPPAQYTYVGNTFDTVLGAYTTSMNNTGGFSVPVQLTPNLPAGTDISAQVLSYSFNDGVQTLTESNSYIVQFSVGTNSFCEISEYRITIWQGDSLVSGIDVVYSTGPPDNSADYGFQGVPCATIAGGRCVASDLAISTGTDYGQLNSIPGTPGVWVGPPCAQVLPFSDIPTLDRRGLLLFTGLMGFVAMWILIRRRLV